jgi:hypothetical protein
MAPHHEAEAREGSGYNSSSNGATEKEPGRKDSALDNRRASTAALLRNPLAGLTTEEILKDVDSFVEQNGLQEYHDEFRKGALLAQVSNTPQAFEHIETISEEEKVVLRREETHKWDQPFMLYFLCILCAGSAVVQGMDQTAVNGAQEFYYKTFNIEGDENANLQGLLNGAPYLCSALIGCWTNPFLNKIGGRRFTIFISCFISVVTGFWMAAANK